MPVLRDYNLLSKELYQEFAQTPGFDFDMEERGVLMLCQTEQMLHEEAEVAVRAREVGVAAKLLNASEVKAMESGIKVKVQGGVHYPGDAHFYSNKFMTQLKANLRQAGVTLLSNKKVVRLNAPNGKVNQILLEDGEIVDIENIVVAAGSWSAKVLKQLGIKILMQDGKGYSITLKNPPIRPTYPTLLMESRVAVTPMGADLRIGGTLEISNLSPKINPKRLAGIIESIPKFYPELQVEMPKLENVWHGFRPCTPDGLPYMGRSKKYPNLVLANGHAMMGMSLGPASGKLVAEILQDKRPSIDLKLFRPERFA
jgi:D-amino-acid dehydrogenase